MYKFKSFASLKANFVGCFGEDIWHDYCNRVAEFWSSCQFQNIVHYPTLTESECMVRYLFDDNNLFDVSFMFPWKDTKEGFEVWRDRDQKWREYVASKKVE